MKQLSGFGNCFLFLDEIEEIDSRIDKSLLHFCTSKNGTTWRNQMMESNRKCVAPPNSGGASLIETLTALAILSFGLAGLGATQFKTLAYLRAVGLESRAALHARGMAERLHRADGSGLSAAELAQWQAEIAAALPAGGGTVCFDSTPRDGGANAPACDGSGPFQAVKLWWDENGDADPERVQIHVLRP